jgi:hypothetical protein
LFDVDPKPTSTSKPLSINGQFGAIKPTWVQCALGARGPICPLQSIDVPIILLCDVGRVLGYGPVQVKSGRSGQTVGNGTATVLAIAITFSRFVEAKAMRRGADGFRGSAQVLNW